MSEGPNPLPPDLEALDQALRRVRFQPRASLGPEVLGRLRRGEAAERRNHGTRARPTDSDMSDPPAVPPFRRSAAVAAVAAVLAVVAAVAASLATRAPGPVLVDRCCYDLDGGTDADDGVLIQAQRDAKVHQLRVYEDLDGSRTFTPGDAIRLDRGETPALREAAIPGLVTIEHCCLDLDGGGPADDGLIVLGVPPDRVVMAAIYETSPGLKDQRARHGGYPLR